MVSFKQVSSCDVLQLLQVDVQCRFSKVAVNLRVRKASFLTRNTLRYSGTTSSLRAANVCISSMSRLLTRWTGSILCCSRANCRQKNTYSRVYVNWIALAFDIVHDSNLSGRQFWCKSPPFFFVLICKLVRARF